MTTCANPRYIDYKMQTFPEVLKEQEAIIEKGLGNVAKALSKIKRLKLYKLTHKTFEEYCKERWKATKTSINWVIAANKIKAENRDLTTHVVKISDSSLGRDIARLPTKKQQRKVIKQVTANGNSPTVKEVKKVVDIELGIIRRKPLVPPELKKYFESEGICLVCGHRKE